MAEITEATETVVEEVATRLSGRETRLILAGVGVGVLVGSVIGGFIQDKRLRTRYEQLAESEIDQMREHFRALHVAREEKPPLEELKGVAEDAGYSSRIEDYTKANEVISEAFLEKDEEHPDTEMEPETRNIFEDRVAAPIEEGWDYATELAKRIDDRIAKRAYVIHEDERQELDYSETEFTYYEGDDVMCDSDDRIIEKPELIIGDDFREQFGHGSGDPNAVYIRNDQLAADIEVTSTPGMYSVEVQGLEGDWDGVTDSMQRRPYIADDDID
jgi:hypothetical protein